MKNRFIRAAALAACAVSAQLPAMLSVSAQESGPQRLQIHGFLTQGLARSSAQSFMGIGTEATADYRTAALQLRYQLGSSDDVILQLSHTRIGNSLLNEINPDVELDWAYWQHRFGPVSARVGKVPMPRGIYNEIRDVGTLLPFYRAPVSIYSEGYETIDGAVVSHSVDWRAWGLDTDVYAGAWKGIELDFDGEDASEVELEQMKRTLAAQLWLRTPLTGLRVGLAGARWVEVDTDGDPPDLEGFMLASVDGTFERSLVRTEFRQSFGADSKRREFYAQLGYRITPAIALNLQGEYATRMHDPEEDENGDDIPNPEEKRFTFTKDLGLGINYSIAPNIVLKLEGHAAKGYNFEQFMVTRGPSASSRYFISSVSLSF
jgi:hypothetical protein